MDFGSLVLTDEQAAAHRAAVAAAMLRGDPAGALDGADFCRLSGAHVERLFDAYDRQFFGGAVRQAVAAATPVPLEFGVSNRMTRAGGKVERRRLRQRGRRPGRGHGRIVEAYRIVISGRLLMLSFDDVDRPIRVGGLVCDSRLAALQRIMEHEIVHLVELVTFGSSSCRQPRFKRLVRQWFGHTRSSHDLITPTEAAAARHRVTPGSVVAFEYRGERLRGRINRINQRATVLVEAPDGRPYTDGRRYHKFYVPLERLEPVTVRV